MLFAVAIVIPAIAWRLGLSAIAAFWWAYVLTRPLGASVADYVSKARSLSGLGFGDGRTAVVTTLAVAIGVAYLAITRSGIQQPAGRPDGQVAPGQAAPGHAAPGQAAPRHAARGQQPRLTRLICPRKRDPGHLARLLRSLIYSWT